MFTLLLCSRIRSNVHLPSVFGHINVAKLQCTTRNLSPECEITMILKELKEPTPMREVVQELIPQKESISMKNWLPKENQIPMENRFSIDNQFPEEDLSLGQLPKMTTRNQELILPWELVYLQELTLPWESVVYGNQFTKQKQKLLLVPGQARPQTKTPWFHSRKKIPLIQWSIICDWSIYSTSDWYYKIKLCGLT